MKVEKSTLINHHQITTEPDEIHRKVPRKTTPEFRSLRLSLASCGWADLSLKLQQGLMEAGDRGTRYGSLVMDRC